MASSPNATRVVVIGAGLSGLAAAWRLRTAGCDVTVLERSQVAGGRAGGARIDGFGIERSLQVLRTNDKHLVRFIREVGVADDLLPLRPVIAAQIHEGRAVPTEVRSPRDVARIGGVRWRQAMRLLRLPRLMRRYGALLDRDAPERAADWDYRSVADFARLYFGPSVYERWIGPMASSATLGNPAELSRVAFLLEWLVEERARFGVARRGLAELPVAAAERLGVSFGVEVSILAPRADGSGRFLVQCSKGSSVEADAVVVTTAAAEAGRISGPALCPAEFDFFAGTRTAPEVVLVAALNRPASGAPQFVRVPAGEVDGIESLLVEPGVADGRAPLGFGVATLTGTLAFCESSAGTGDEIVTKEMIAGLERVFPSVVGTIRFTRLFRREASIPRFEVGAYRALDRFRRVQADRRSLGRRLYFAGDYASGLAPDQRVGSGLRAADDLLRDFA